MTFLECNQVRCSPLQGLFDELLGARASRGQHALVVGALADVAAEDFQDPRCRRLAGQLGGVVGHAGVAPVLWPAQAPAPAVPEERAAVEHGGKPVVVATDFVLGRLPHACGALQ